MLHSNILFRALACVFATAILHFPSHSKAQKVRFLSPSNTFSWVGRSPIQNAATCLVDLDKDGDLDAVVANGRHWDRKNRVFLNNGEGKLRLAGLLKGPMDPSFAVVSADFNRDGKLDVAIANHKAPNRLYWGRGNGTFEKPVNFGHPKMPSWDLLAEDFNGDGYMDLVVVNREQAHEICFNDGKGNFDRSLTFGDPKHHTVDMAAADMDGDGYTDLVAANLEATANLIYFNNGKGVFNREGSFGNPEDRSRSLAIADLNGDGKKEIVVGNVRGPNYIYWNLGAEITCFDKADDITLSLAVADLDGDKDLDIFSGNSQGPNFAYYNDGTGKAFKVVVMESPKDSETYHITCGDLNGDGIPEVIESHMGLGNNFYQTTKVPQ